MQSEGELGSSPRHAGVAGVRQVASLRRGAASAPRRSRTACRCDDIVLRIVWGNSRRGRTCHTPKRGASGSPTRPALGARQHVAGDAVDEGVAGGEAQGHSVVPAVKTSPRPRRKLPKVAWPRSACSMSPPNRRSATKRASSRRAVPRPASARARRGWRGRYRRSRSSRGAAFAGRHGQARLEAESAAVGLVGAEGELVAEDVAVEQVGAGEAPVLRAVDGVAGGAAREGVAGARVARAGESDSGHLRLRAGDQRIRPEARQAALARGAEHGVRGSARMNL